MLLASESSISQVLKKFGSFEPLFEYNPNQYFNKLIIAFYPAPKTRTLHIKNDTDVFDYKPNSFFYLLSLNHYLLKLMFIVKREQITLLRATSPYIVGLLGLILSRLTRVPFCVSIHADYDLGYQVAGTGPVLFGSRKLAKRLERFVLSHAKMVMPISEHVAKYAISSGARPESIRIIPHGIEPTPFSQPPDLEIKRELEIEDKKVISFVGRLAPDNYVKDVVEIASEVCQSRKDALFLMVGDGRERENLEQLTQDLGLNKNIRFLGYQPQDRVAQIMLLSDVNLCPLSGFSLIEAAMSGKPIVAYDVEWHSELVKNNEAGFLVPEGDIKGAANAIVKLLDDPELSQRLGENAKKLAIERHSLENTSKIKVKCYEELLSG